MENETKEMDKKEIVMLIDDRIAAEGKPDPEEIARLTEKLIDINYTERIKREMQAMLELKAKRLQANLLRVIEDKRAEIIYLNEEFEALIKELQDRKRKGTISEEEYNKQLNEFVKNENERRADVEAKYDK